MQHSISNFQDNGSNEFVRPSDKEVAVVRRPWGKFEQFVTNENASVKVLTVDPGSRLSLQRHRQRAEMWQVLDVPMQIQVEERVWDAHVGEVVMVPRGALHRITNNGPTPGRLLEICFGNFDEDDIERLEDDYFRNACTQD